MITTTKIPTVYVMVRDAASGKSKSLTVRGASRDEVLQIIQDAIDGQASKKRPKKRSRKSA